MPFRPLLILLISAVLLRAAGVDGNWEAQMKTPDGGVRTQYFALHQNGAELTGKSVTDFGDTAIRNGKVDGNHFQFEVPLGDSGRVIAWTGTVESDGLHLKSTRPDNRTVEMVAKPADASKLAPPPKQPLPALKDLTWNKLSKKPPMGWNSWNKFQRRVDDKAVREMADAIVRTGMKDAGYLYVNIDDTWQGERDAQGHIHANSRFPDMKALSDYVHSKGLLIGIYSSPGPKTCAGFEGSFGHEVQDAETYSEWGFDYLKYDWCSAGRVYQDGDMQAVYQKMEEALAAQPRPIVYSLCQYGRAEVWKWGPKVSGNLWRTTGDIRDSWDSMSKIGFAQNELGEWAGPGHWNDPDMLEVGNGGMTDDEYRTHMTLWAMLAAPLLAGNDLRSMDKKTFEILLNKEVIGIDQDALGKQGTRVSKDGDKEIWTKPLSRSATAVALFNRGAEDAPMTVKLTDFGAGRLVIRDLWKHEFVKATGETWETTVPKHGVTVLRISKAN